MLQCQWQVQRYDLRPNFLVTVAYSAGVYYIDSDFVSSLVVNPRPLLECDGARFEPTTSGYEVVGVTSGTLVHALGLRNGDIILEINNVPLDSAEDAANALGEFYFDAQETQYALEFIRGSGQVTYDYELQ